MPSPQATIRNEFEWGTIEWLANAEVGNSRELSLARMTLPAGKATDSHAHGNCEEAIYVLRGRVECRVAGGVLPLQAGERAVVPRGAVHAIRNAGAAPAELMLSYSSAAREFTLAD